MTTPQAPSRIWATSSSPPAIDSPIKQDANFAGNPASLRQYRSYRDSQILGLESHIVQSLVGGLTGTIVQVASASAPITPGQWVCSTGNGVVPALAAALAAAGLPLGIALTPGSPGGLVRIALGGLVPPQVTGILAGSQLYAVINQSTGFTQATTTPSVTDYPVGAIDASGNLALQIQLPTIVNGGTSWKTAIDLDLTTQANQSFATDTTYSYAGFTATKFRSVADATAPASVNGTGLVFQPTTGNVATIGTAALEYPRLQIPLASIPGLANVAHDWPLRIFARVSAVTSTSGAQALLALAPNATSVPAFYAIGKGQTNTFQAYESNSSSSGGFAYSDSGAYSTYDSVCLQFPGGLSGGVAGALLAAYSSGWPAPSAFYWAGSIFTTSVAFGGSAGLMSNWGISLGAAASGVLVTATFTRLRVDYQIR